MLDVSHHVCEHSSDGVNWAQVVNNGRTRKTTHELVSHETLVILVVLQAIRTTYW